MNGILTLCAEYDEKNWVLDDGDLYNKVTKNRININTKYNSIISILDTLKRDIPELTTRVDNIINKAPKPDNIHEGNEMQQYIKAINEYVDKSYNTIIANLNHLLVSNNYVGENILYNNKSESKIKHIEKLVSRYKEYTLQV